MSAFGTSPSDVRILVSGAMTIRFFRVRSPPSVSASNSVGIVCCVLRYKMWCVLAPPDLPIHTPVGAQDEDHEATPGLAHRANPGRHCRTLEGGHRLCAAGRP